jgi:hypothetical protein
MRFAEVDHMVWMLKDLTRPAAGHSENQSKVMRTAFHTLHPQNQFSAAAQVPIEINQTFAVIFRESDGQFFVL